MTEPVVDQPPPCADHTVSFLTCGPCRKVSLAHYGRVMESEEYLRPAPAVYRVGQHQPRNVYRGDEYIGVMFDPSDAALVVDALNGNGPLDARVGFHAWVASPADGDNAYYCDRCNVWQSPTNVVGRCRKYTGARS